MWIKEDNFLVAADVQQLRIIWLANEDERLQLSEPTTE